MVRPALGFGIVMAPTALLAFLPATGWLTQDQARVASIGSLIWFVLSVVGVGLFWQRDRVPRLTVVVPRAWLPDPSDLASITMTNADLDDAHRRALTHAIERMAPDARLVFSYLEFDSALRLGYHEPSPFVRFWAESDAAEKVADVQAHETFVLGEAHRRGTDRVGSQPTAPWRDDPSWRALVIQGGYRSRPFRGAARLDFRSGEWRLEVQDNRDGLLHAYVLKAGELTDLEAGKKRQ